MKVVTLYIAFDDQEFDTMEKCQEYENQYITLVTELNNSMSMFDRDMNKMEFLNVNDIEETLTDFATAFDACEYVTIHNKFSPELSKFIDYNFGYDIPEKEGTWRYNIYTGNWDKV